MILKKSRLYKNTTKRVKSCAFREIRSLS